MAAKKTVAKKEKGVDYKELCEFYEHLIDHKNLDIDFLSDENEVLKKTVQGKDKFATTQEKKILNLDIELSNALREMSAIRFSKACALNTNEQLMDEVKSLRVDRLALTFLSIALVCVIIFVK